MTRGQWLWRGRVGFAVAGRTPYLTSSVAVATAGILAAGLVAGPPEVSVARNEVREMQLIAIALPSTTPRPAMPMSFVRNQGRSVLSVIPASIGGADAISAVAFVSAVQASSPLKEVIEPTTNSKIEPAKARSAGHQCRRGEPRRTSAIRSFALSLLVLPSLL